MFQMRNKYYSITLPGNEKWKKFHRYPQDIGVIH